MNDTTNDRLGYIMDKYKDGVPVKIERMTIVWLAFAVILTVGACAIVVKAVKKI